MDTFWNGYIASAVGLYTVYPVDTIKTHIQNNSLNQLRVSGLYHGVVPQLLFVGGAKSLRFVLFEESVSRLGVSEPLHHLYAGAFAGFGISIFTNPLEVHKVRKQMKQSFRLQDSYKGWRVCMLRETVMGSSMFYFKNILQDVVENKVLLSLLASLPGCILSIPFDVFKTRFQTRVAARKTVMDAVLEEGIGVFWKGGSMRILKALPQTALTMYLYDWLSTSPQTPRLSQT